MKSMLDENFESLFFVIKKFVPKEVVVAIFSESLWFVISKDETKYGRKELFITVEIDNLFFALLKKSFVLNLFSEEVKVNFDIVFIVCNSVAKPYFVRNSSFSSINMSNPMRNL